MHRTVTNVSAKVEKKLKYFPGLAENEQRRKDNFLRDFLVMQESNPFEAQLDPESTNYMFPDFGFNNGLHFSDFEGFHNPWKLFSDYVRPFPKFERLKNYIDFVNKCKVKKLQES